MQQRTIGDGRVSLQVSQLCLGTMWFGYRTDEATSFAILDRFLEAGGNFLDTANNYGQWHGDAGESERVLGRWMKSRGVTNRMVVATKVGARTTVPGDPDAKHWQGLTAEHIRSDAELSLKQLGVDRLDLYYAHIEDRSTPLEETVGAFAELAAGGKVGLLGASNHATWRIAQARAIAGDRPSYSCIQQRHTYLLPLPEVGNRSEVTPEMVDFATAEGLTILPYSPLLQGTYTRGGLERWPAYDHPANRERLAVLAEVAAELGATPNQVVLAWIMQGAPAMIPIAGASSLTQLDELLGAAELRLDAEVRARLDGAGRGPATG